MEKKLKWLENERKKDSNDILIDKNRFIKEILQHSKKEVVKGPKKIEKEKTWKTKILKILGL